MTIHITLHINRRFVFVTCLGLIALVLLVAPWQASAAPQAALTAATCPTAQPPIPPAISIAAIQRFEHGYMLWIGDGRTLYVMYNTTADAYSGTFEVYPETWEQGMPESDPSLVPPLHMWQPTRGGGLLWRTNKHVRDGLGWGTSDPGGYMAVITKIDNKIWVNGRDDAFTFDGAHWQEIYFWRK